MLIADDMQLNQFLMGELLKDCGFVPICAGTGQEAIRLATDELFAVIFLDIYMPVMDGLECAQQIRSLSNANATVPIVAITANQFESNESVFKKAGISATLIKPITKEQIEQLLTEFFGEATVFPPANLAATGTVFNTKTLLDLTYLKKISNENPVFLVRMLDSFCTTTEQLVIELEKAIQQKNFVTTKNLVHQLKFPLSMVGQSELVTQLNDFEKNSQLENVMGLEKDDFSLVERLLPTVKSLITQARVQLSKMTL